MNKFLFLFGLLISATLSATDVKANLHALLICDTLAPKLKEAYLCDLERMKENVERIAGQSQLSLDLNVFTDKQVTSKSIEKWISTLHLEKKDVVLVYYVGRQDRHAKSKGRWPVFKAAQHQGLSASTLAKKLQKRKPRLTLVFFDCYDRSVYISPNALSMSLEKIPIDCGRSNGYPLFIGAKGLFMACSCSKKEKSIGLKQNKEIGGAFTTALIKSISLNIFQPTWGKGADLLNWYYDGCFKFLNKPLIHQHVIDPCYIKDIAPATV